MDKKESASYRGPDLKLFVRDVRDRQRKKRPVTVRSWSTVKDVKDAIRQAMKIPPCSQRLFFGPLLTSGGELPNHRTLHDVGIYRSGETILLDIKSSTNLPSTLSSASSSSSCTNGGGATPSSASAFSLSTSSSSSSLYSLRPSPTCNDVCISSSMMDSTPRRLRSLVQEARRGFALGLKPEFVLEGSGGTYFLHDARKAKIAVFKPADEEPYADNNPRGYLRQAGQPLSLRDGVAPGEACIREVAAYLLDHDSVLGVPMTTLAEARHPAFNTNGARLKVSEGGASIGAHSIVPNSPTKPATMKKAGSFQEFVRCECTMDDISPSKISVDEVHKIAILDIRIMNADRNTANLLVKRRPEDGSLELVPIDHGYCLRSVSDVSWMDWCWLDWPQLKKPVSDRLRKYILDLDIEADARMLQERLNICQEAVDYFRASSSLLKAGVRAGLTLYDIAIRCCRNDNSAEVPSMLEKLTDMASDLASAAIENERWHHTAASRALVEQLTPRHKRRGSMMSRLSSGSSTGSRMSKSSSSAEFRVLQRDSLLVDTLNKVASLREEDRSDSPAMAQSSASDDSSSEAVEDCVGTKEDDGDCEEWAASILIDVSVDQIIPRQLRGGRSGSIASDDGSSDGSALSSSPKGFWHVRPDSSPVPSCEDDGSLSSSPRNSLSSVCSDTPLTLLGDSSSAEFGKPQSSNNKTPTVTFAASVLEAAPGPYFAFKPMKAVSAPPSCDGDGPAASSIFVHKENAGLQTPLLQRADSGMSRSKSYSALSAMMDGKAPMVSASASPAAASAAMASPAHAENYEIFRAYFEKFIDLVIVREVTAASALSKCATPSKTKPMGASALPRREGSGIAVRNTTE